MRARAGGGGASSHPRRRRYHLSSMSSAQPPAAAGAEIHETLRAVRVERKPFEGEVHDVMGGSARWEVKVHDHGLVALVDVMPRFAPVGKTADFAIVQAARVSYGAGTKQVNEDRGLIRYLMRHRHTTPMEMNEYSARYSVVRDRYYRPTVSNVRKQSATNRQGGTEQADDMTAKEFVDWLD